MQNINNMIGHGIRRSSIGVVDAMLMRRTSGYDFTSLEGDFGEVLDQEIYKNSRNLVIEFRANTIVRELDNDVEGKNQSQDLLKSIERDKDGNKIRNFYIQKIEEFFKFLKNDYELSLWDFSSIFSQNIDLSGVKPVKAYIRVSSLSKIPNLIKEINSKKIVNFVKKIKDFSDFSFTDKVLILNKTQVNISLVRNILESYGDLISFKQVSMRKYLAQYDNEKSLKKFREDHSLHASNDPILSVCYPFCRYLVKKIFIDNSNPFKLNQILISQDTNNNITTSSSRQNSQNFKTEKKIILGEKDSNIMFSINNKGNKRQKSEFDSNTGFKFDENQLRFFDYSSKKSTIKNQKISFFVDLHQLQNNSEKRRTFMIRNIPNSFTRVDLLQSINPSLRGLYDFLYLPIDFTVSIFHRLLII